MAKVTNNIFIRNLSGTIGKRMNVYDLNGQTVVREAKKKGNTKFTEAQIALQDKFSDAVCFAKDVLEDPDLRFYYQSLAQSGQNAYNMAMKDAMGFPELTEVDYKAYDGNPGDKILIRSRGIFRICEIHVAIFNEAGMLIEEGYATEERTPMVWVYRATKELNSNNAKVIVTAENIPGNKTTDTRTIKV